MDAFFKFCCDVMAFAGKCIGLSYGEINVLTFLYIEPVLLIVIGLLYMKKDLLMGLLNVCSWSYVLFEMQRHYPVTDAGFKLIYADLHALADYLGMSHAAVNYVLFIMIPIIYALLLLSVFLPGKWFAAKLSRLKALWEHKGLKP